MDNPLIERINSRLEKLGKTERAASLEATGKPDAIRMIRVSKSRSPRIDTLVALARALETSVDWLWTGAGSEEPGAPAANAVDLSDVENIAYFLHEQGIPRHTSAAEFARITVDLCRHLARKPHSDLGELVEYGVGRLGRPGRLDRAG